PDRPGDPAGEADVIVFDQNRVVQPEPMVRPAAGAHRVLLQFAERWRRFAGVEDRDAAAGGVDETPRQRRNAAEPLEKVERGALAGEERPRRPGNGRNRGAGRAALAVSGADGDRDAGFELPEGLQRHVEAGDDAVLFGEKEPL